MDVGKKKKKKTWMRMPAELSLLLLLLLPWLLCSVLLLYVWERESACFFPVLDGDGNGI